MRTALISMGILMLLATPALAGRNANGALVVHTDDSIVYTSTANYCATEMPATCEALGTQTNKPVEEVEAVIWFLAAFADLSSPGVTTIQFGVHHNLPSDQGYISAYGSCGPSPLELPDAGWPEPNDCGNLVAYGTPVYSRLFTFYWFAAIGVENGYFGTRTYPSTDEAKFVDDGSPPVEDLIFAFGTVRWGGPGQNKCAVFQGGACCFAGGECAVLLADECVAQGGQFQGVDTVCDPNPCPIAWGACCFVDGHCEIMDGHVRRLQRSLVRGGRVLRPESVSAAVAGVLLSERQLHFRSAGTVRGVGRKRRWDSGRPVIRSHARRRPWAPAASATERAW